MRSAVDDPFPLRCVRGSLVVRLVLIHYIFGDEGIRRGERMAAHYGRLTEFDRGVEEWVTYIERLEQYFAANEIADNGKKRAILLSACGAATYRLIRTLVSPSKPGEKSFTEIVKLVSDHHNPKPSAIMQRFKFNCRIRESVAEYVTSLRHLAEHCEYGQFLDDMLRDRIVRGINDAQTQRRLLGEAGLTLKGAFEIALAMESATKSCVELQSTSTQFLDTETQSISQPVPQPVHRLQGKPGTDKTGECFRCGGNHMATTCWARTVECNKCGKIGHIARVCRSNKHPKKGRREVEQAKRDLKVVCDDEETEIGDTHTVYALGNEKCDPFIVPVYFNGVCVHLELDTGASMTLISKKTLDKLWARETRPKLRSTSTRLRTYTGESLEVLGIAVVDVVYRDQQAKLKLVVEKQDGPCLLGRDWLKAIKFDVSFIHAVTASVSNIQQLLNVHATLFEEKLGLFKGVVAKLLLNPIGEKQPKFYKARTVPFALKERIEKELGSLQAVGIISPVHSSEWAAPIVPVVKQDGSVQICGDYKLTANRVITFESYPIPQIEELFASLSGGVEFSKLDLKNAYLKLELEKNSKQYTTINTHKGLFHYNRLPFGIASAPAIFQRAIETLLQGIPYTCAYFDDIVVTGKTDDEHLQNLQLVFQKLESVGLKLNKEKCVFMAPSIEYLGHQMDKDGLHPTDEKVTCIKQAPTPSTITELKAFMGLLNYYGKFIPKLATVLAPLYRLLQKDTKWNWGRDQQEAFKCAKDLLQSSTLLVHYDPKRQLVLTCDASPFGVGAVVAHIMDDGSERPVGYASRSLSQAEKGYSQLDKEALAIVFGVTKFNSYLYGRLFTIYSDHKPLMYFFGEHKGIPTMASARVLQWAVTLSAYQYSIRYKPGSEVCHADALSRLPIPSSDTDCIPGSIIGLIDFMSSTPMSSELVKKHTQRDPVLSRVCQFVLKGWTEKKLGEPFFPYESRKYELSVQDGVLLWGSRIVVPPRMRSCVLDELHETHQGIVKMKGLARGYVRWPGMDSDIEKLVKSCNTCQVIRHFPPTAPLHPWEWPKQPWSRLHADYAGPFQGHMFCCW